ncbi:ABC transporter substrate-binding protein, partial [Candidatus Sumerlaeota bacterium]|nr:ABC transporter substrate-binding protein [Candidatus Sumerlaeota bacterium]
MVYTALDQLYSEPILQLFEQRTGVRVRAVYDSEAAKTVGLVNRLIAERGRPRCDVFWNNEIIRTIRLKKEGLLDSYVSPHAEGIPESFKDSAGFWTGFAGRARVLAFNTKLATKEQAPRDVADLVNPVWKGKIAMAYPLFGSTSTHAAVLFSLWGVEGSKSFFLALKANDVRIMDGNMTVC